MATQTREIKVGDRVRGRHSSQWGVATVEESNDDHGPDWLTIRYDNFKDYDDSEERDGHTEKAFDLELVEDDTTDAVNPTHYDLPNGLQVIDIVRGMDYLRGNVIKYVVRAGKKNPDTRREDLLKARKYLDWLIEDSDD